VLGLGGSGSPGCFVTSSGLSHSGVYSIKFTGNDNSTIDSWCRFMAFDVDIPVTSGLQLSYWSYPLNENGRYAAVDLLMTDGSSLRSLDLKDVNGLSMKPSQGRGVVNTWSKTVCNIGQWLNGKTIDKILVTYDQSASIGDFSGYIDDIILTSNSINTGFENLSADNQTAVRIYPTVLHNEDIIVDASALNTHSQQLEVYVTTIEGDIILNRSFKSDTKIKISLQLFSKGIYLVVVKGDSFRNTQKVIKH
jgi:hypothetical protein